MPERVAQTLLFEPRKLAPVGAAELLEALADVVDEVSAGDWLAVRNVSTNAGKLSADDQVATLAAYKAHRQGLRRAPGARVGGEP